MAADNFREVLAAQSEADDGPPLDTLERALWRADRMIDATTSPIEDSETRLADALADLMHWAARAEVDFDEATARAEESRRQELSDWGLPGYAS